jgi:peptide/nickel transport system permease protein
MLPIITLVALSLGFIIGGAITVEYVFSYPASASSSSRRSTSATTRCCRRRSFLLTLSVILFNLLADLLYFRLDPRVTE